MWKKFKRFFFPYYWKEKEGYYEQAHRIGNENYLIREIFPTDIDALLHIERLVYEGQVPWSKSAFLSELYAYTLHFYIAILHQKEIVGFLGLRVSENDGHITNIAILPEYQRRGLASLLIAEAEKFALENECQTMSLEVRITNLEAQSLYQKLGFDTRQTLVAYYSEGNEDALDMVKPIK